MTEKKILDYFNDKEKEIIRRYEAGRRHLWREAKKKEPEVVK